MTRNTSRLPAESKQRERFTAYCDIELLRRWDVARYSKGIRKKQQALEASMRLYIRQSRDAERIEG